MSKNITDDMLRQMFRGLEGDETESSLLMLPSWLPSLPSGAESGAVLAVDFGGTSFRVMQVVLGTDIGEVVCQSRTMRDLRDNSVYATRPASPAGSCVVVKPWMHTAVALHKQLANDHKTQKARPEHAQPLKVFSIVIHGRA